MEKNSTRSSRILSAILVIGKPLKFLLDIIIDLSVSYFKCNISSNPNPIGKKQHVSIILK